MYVGMYTVQTPEVLNKSNLNVHTLYYYDWYILMHVHFVYAISPLYPNMMICVDKKGLVGSAIILLISMAHSNLTEFVSI